MVAITVIHDGNTIEELSLTVAALENDISELKGELFVLAQRLRNGYETIEKERAVTNNIARLSRWEDSWLVFLRDYEEKDEVVQALEGELVTLRARMLTASEKTTRPRQKRARAS